MSKLALALTALAALAMADPAGAQQAPPTSAQAKRIEAMVNKAAALVDKEGKAAFAAFRKPNSEWRFGYTYLFAYYAKLNVLLSAAFPEQGRGKYARQDRLQRQADAR